MGITLLGNAAAAFGTMGNPIEIEAVNGAEGYRAINENIEHALSQTAHKHAMSIVGLAADGGVLVSDIGPDETSTNITLISSDNRESVIAQSVGTESDYVKSIPGTSLIVITNPQLGTINIADLSKGQADETTESNVEFQFSGAYPSIFSWREGNMTRIGIIYDKSEPQLNADGLPDETKPLVNLRRHKFFSYEQSSDDQKALREDDTVPALVAPLIDIVDNSMSEYSSGRSRLRPQYNLMVTTTPARKTVPALYFSSGDLFRVFCVDNQSNAVQLNPAVDFSISDSGFATLLPSENGTQTTEIFALDVDGKVLTVTTPSRFVSELNPSTIGTIGLEESIKSISLVGNDLLRVYYSMGTISRISIADSQTGATEIYIHLPKSLVNSRIESTLVDSKNNRLIIAARDLFGHQAIYSLDATSKHVALMREPILTQEQRRIAEKYTVEKVPFIYYTEDNKPLAAIAIVYHSGDAQAPWLMRGYGGFGWPVPFYSEAVRMSLSTGVNAVEIMLVGDGLNPKFADIGKGLGRKYSADGFTRAIGGLKERYGIDPANITCLGHSNGAFVLALAIARALVRGDATYAGTKLALSAGTYNMARLIDYDTENIMSAYIAEHLLDLGTVVDGKPQPFVETNPYGLLANIVTTQELLPKSMTFFAGTDDTRVNPQHTRDMFELLVNNPEFRERVGAVLIDGLGHYDNGTPQAKVDYLRMLLGLIHFK